MKMRKYTRSRLPKELRNMTNLIELMTLDYSRGYVFAEYPEHLIQFTGRKRVMTFHPRFPFNGQLDGYVPELTGRAYSGTPYRPENGEFCIIPGPDQSGSNIKQSGLTPFNLYTIPGGLSIEDQRKRGGSFI